jgi:ESX secretion-associated protein EspB
MPVATAPAAAAAAPGGMAGGMGGMAPMHGHGAQQGKEKRRDPRTAPDEDLYVEDRPWTEGVVGNRRRREVQDGRPREHDDEQDDDE